MVSDKFHSHINQESDRISFLNVTQNKIKMSQCEGQLLELTIPNLNII